MRLPGGAALQDLARAPRRLDAHLGLLGVSHTRSRALVYHPHVHYLVPGGGLSLDQRAWVPCRKKFLVHVHPQAEHFRAVFRQALARVAPAALAAAPARGWRTRWVVHCEPAGTGQRAPPREAATISGG